VSANDEGCIADAG